MFIVEGFANIMPYVMAFWQSNYHTTFDAIFLSDYIEAYLASKNKI